MARCFHASASTAALLLLCTLSVFISRNALTEGQEFVDTTPSVNLLNGTKGILPCNVTAPHPESVYWLNGSSFVDADVMIGVDLTIQPGEKSGPGYDAGSLDITEHFSLVIENVTFQNSGQYICMTFDLQLNQPFWDSTNVTVFEPPTKPYPVFEQCLANTSRLYNERNCTIYSELSEMNITCSVNRYYPDFEIYIRNENVLHDALRTTLYENVDGTKNKSVTIRAVPGPHSYECVAAGIGPSGKMSEIFSTIIIHRKHGEVPLKPPHNQSRVTKIMLPLSSIGIVGIIVFLYIKRKRRRRHATEEISPSSEHQEDTPLRQTEYDVLPSSEHQEDTLLCESEDHVSNYVAAYDFVGQDEKELSFTKGEELKIIHILGYDWWYARSKATGQEGHVPCNRIRPKWNENWYFGKCGRKEAEKMLLAPGLLKGTFIVRDGESKPSTYSLSVRVFDAGTVDITHYTIEIMDNDTGYYIDKGPTFQTMRDLLQNYQLEPPGLKCVLNHPCRKGTTEQAALADSPTHTESDH